MTHQVIVRRKYSPQRDGVAHEGMFRTPKTAWVVGVEVGDTWWVPCVWPSVKDARVFAGVRGADFTSWVAEVES